MKITKLVGLWAKSIKRDAVMLWFARKHPDMPLRAKIVCVVAVLYALSPIDLIPDFIPILGYIDDALLLPAMIWLAIRLMPLQVLASSRTRADAWVKQYIIKPKSYIGAAIVLALWCVFAYLGWRWISAS